MRSAFRQLGFTVMEVLVVVGLFAILTTIGLFFSMDFFRTYTASSQELTLVSALSKARARSLANVNENWHGLRVTGSDYILFQGDDSPADWDHRDDTLDQNIPVETGVSASGPDIVFTQLSGDTPCNPDDCEIDLTGVGGDKKVTVTKLGAILW